MARIKKFDVLSTTDPLDLVGESGFLPLANFVPHGLSNPDDDYGITIFSDDGSTLTNHIYADGSFLGSQQYDYQRLSSDFLYTDVRFYSSEGVLLESWSELNQLASEVIASSSLAVLESEDVVEGTITQIICKVRLAMISWLALVAQIGLMVGVQTMCFLAVKVMTSL